METVFRFLCFSADHILLLRQDIKQILKMIRLRHYLHFVNSSSCSYLRLLLKPFSSQRFHLEDVGPMASMLKSRAVIRFRGPDTVKFLQGLVTNDVRSFCEPVGQKSSNFPMPNVPAASVPPVYAALLTPQGRFLFDLFLYRPPQPDQKFDRTGSGPGPKPDVLELFADVDASVLDELMATFIKYRLRSNVDIESVTEEFSCWQRFGGNLAKKSSVEEPEAAGVGYGGAVDHSGIAATRGNGPGWQWYKDPRLECLGHRGIFAYGTTPPLVEADKMTDEENYLLWRMDKGVAEGSTEIPKREAIPLEYNFDGLNAISFNKGCYVGQELIARTHHRGNIRKRLLPLKFLDDGGQELGQKVVPGSEVVDAASKKKAGTVTTAIGSRGLGLLRLDETFRGKGPLTIKGQEDVKVEAIRPEWWPAEWLQDHQQIKASA